MKKTISLFIILLTLSSCKEYLSEKDLKYMPYKNGERLIFENENLNLIDTIIISNLEKFIPDGPQLHFNETIIAKTGESYLVRINAGYGKNSDSYLEIEGLIGKFYLEDFEKLKKHKLEYEGKTIYDVIILKTEKEGNSRIKKVYWSISEGIIKYETKKGNIWKIKNE
ncbi:hypothetical protein [Polaribacter marinivivus]|uniref:Lipoprotein n=1 Tax=Polaribacter marinivivus TaxID=1524260 RepID=A0ABV8R4C5_9FLAO